MPLYLRRNARCEAGVFVCKLDDIQNPREAQRRSNYDVIPNPAEGRVRNLLF